MNLTREEHEILLALLDARIDAMQACVAAVSLRNKRPEAIDRAKETIERLKIIRQKVAEA